MKLFSKALLLGLTIPFLMATGCNDGDARRKADWEINRAENTLQDLRDINAPRLASREYSKAESHFNKGTSLAKRERYREAYDHMQAFYPIASKARQKALAAKRSGKDMHRAGESDRQRRLAAQRERERQEALEREKRIAKHEAKKEEMNRSRKSRRSSRVEYYEVQKGDTLWEIAQKEMNDHYKWSDILKANEDIKNADMIYPGQKIQIPRQ